MSVLFFSIFTDKRLQEAVNLISNFNYLSLRILIEHLDNFLTDNLHSVLDYS